jgi:hypothetical protein
MPERNVEPNIEVATQETDASSVLMSEAVVSVKEPLKPSEEPAPTQATHDPIIVVPEAAK